MDLGLVSPRVTASLNLSKNVWLPINGDERPVLATIVIYVPLLQDSAAITSVGYLIPSKAKFVVCKATLTGAYKYSIV